MSEITLKPCPCCRGEAEILKQGHREYAPTYSVRCKACGLTTGNHKSEKEASRIWNTRRQDGFRAARGCKVTMIRL